MLVLMRMLTRHRVMGRPARWHLVEPRRPLHAHENALATVLVRIHSLRLAGLTVKFVKEGFIKE
jgi:hypothetical protein